MLNHKNFTCPVCGFDGLEEPPRDVTGAPSYEICPCCGTEFGYDDATRTHEELRRSWLQAGARWWSQQTSPPPGWDLQEQLKRASLLGSSERTS